MAGLPPGTPTHVGERKIETARITLIDYDAAKLDEKQLDDVRQCLPCKDTDTVSWINIDGLHDMHIVETLGRHFGLHPLVLEDITNTQQRPKLEDFESYLFVVVKMFQYDGGGGHISTEQVSLILGPNFVISFQEKAGDVFEPIRQRIRGGKGRIRQMGADYLLFSLLDAIVDAYFLILEKLGERVETLEEKLLADPSPQAVQTIQSLKRDMILLRRSVWPLREAIGTLERSESRLIHKPVRVYFRDVYDHTIQVMDAVETFRDVLSGMLDIYLSSVSNRMNEVMKVLTIIATIFMPLAFIAGIYGMNFKRMPELDWPFGYFAALGVMAVIAGGMLLYFRRKRWI